MISSVFSYNSVTIAASDKIDFVTHGLVAVAVYRWAANLCLSSAVALQTTSRTIVVTISANAAGDLSSELKNLATHLEAFIALGALC